MDRTQLISHNIQQLKAGVPPGTTIIAVSKTFPLSDIQLAHQGGQGHRDFGENRVQELTGKAHQASALGLPLRWHFMGRIQSNKLKKLVSIPTLTAIHSLSELKHVDLLADLAPLRATPVGIFLQVKTSHEAAKDGFTSLEELQTARSRLAPLAQCFPLIGLMTIGAIRVSDFAQAAEQSFRRLVAIRDQLDPKLKLSMGMSRDYPIALRYGSHYIRVGSGVFGERHGQ